MLSETGFGGVAVLAFTAGFFAGGFFALGAVAFVIVGVFWSISDRRPISHERMDMSNDDPAYKRAYLRLVRRFLAPRT